MRGRGASEQHTLGRGQWDGLVVMCAGTSWDGVWFPDKHIASRLTSFAPVLYVDPPVSLTTPLRHPELAPSRRGSRLRRIGPSLARLTPMALPGMHRSGLHVLTQSLVRRQIARAVRSLTGSVAAVVTAACSVPFGVCGERLRVLYATDDFVAGAKLMGLPEERLRRCEERLAREADLVVAVSKPLAKKWRALGKEVVLIPNGCDYEAIARVEESHVPDDVRLTPPIVGFVGHLSERIDLSFLEAIAARGRSVLLVGPRQATFDIGRVGALLARPNVQWVGSKPFEDLPSYLRVIDVGLTPYADTPFNRASFPLKTLEYLAAGRAVVATDLPAVRWLGSDLIRVGRTPSTFADEVDTALSEPRDGAVISRRQAVAAEHSWSNRTREFAAAIGLSDTAR